MARDGQAWTVNDRKATHRLQTKWGVSRARGYEGYAICSLYVNGRKVASCNGGGYDMVGTVVGLWLAHAYHDRLRERITQEFYGLQFADPTFDPGKALIDGETIEDREKAGKSIGLERYQAFHAATSKLPTEQHTVPVIDGACGLDCMWRIGEAIGVTVVRK